jgi:phosphoribosylaminoimidazole carboxylase PurE protein
MEPVVGIVMGSESDRDIMKEAEKALSELNIGYEIIVSSAHRDPDKTREYAVSASSRGIKVIIAGAGFSAHLPGFIASLTKIPVIGVPLDTSPLKGIDSLLSIVQMPKGVPVGTMGIGRSGARNAALFAARILGVQ